MIIIIKNLISDGGIFSKNSPKYSIESFLLAIQKKYVDGIKINLYQTKDNILIPIDNEIKNKLKIDDTYIKNNTYLNLKKLNIGNKVKTNNIITLNELITNLDNKKIIIDVSNTVNINILQKIIKNNKNINWYITSKSKLILEDLILNKDSYNIGIYVNDLIDLEFDFDFYIVNVDLINNIDIKSKIMTLNNIFINNVISLNQINNLNIKNLYFISKNVTKLYKSLIQ